MWHYSLNQFSRYHHTGVFRMLYNEHSKEYLGMNVTWNFSPPMQKASDEVYDSPFPWVTFTYVHLQLQLITEKGPACFASQTGEGSSSCCNPGWSIHGVALPRNPSLAVTRRGWLCLPPQVLFSLQTWLPINSTLAPEPPYHVPENGMSRQKRPLGPPVKPVWR